VRGFSAQWLALREPYDLAARNASVLEAVVGAFSDQNTISVVDLACGTGATLRAISPQLPPLQSWRLVDNDLGLLVRDLELALDGPLDLVTASALLDLVSAEWLDRLVVETAARRLPVYAALTYDGRAVVTPDCSFDGDLLTSFDRHQRTDKGFGPALGPTAAARAVERFEALEYSVLQGRSDWVFGPHDRAIQEAVFAGWAEVGTLTGRRTADEIAGWLAHRRAHLAAGRSNLRVGHVDIFAWPMATR
jgi:hypothetical protein